MVRGLYTAATGALVAQANVDVISNNLANVNTTGFKRSLLQIESAPTTTISRNQIDPGATSTARGVATQTPIGELGFGSRMYDTPAVFEQGPIQMTGNPLDVALSGPGFFAVRDSSGATRYTRGGSFVADAQNNLVTGDGDAVLGADGQPLRLTPTTQGTQPQGQAAQPQATIAIDKQGNITANGQSAGQLAVFEFADRTTLRPEGANKFVNAGAAPQAATQTSVLQGAQEKSNADVISAMVGLITNERWFDANEKMIQTQDTEVGAAIASVGKTTS